MRREGLPWLEIVVTHVGLVGLAKLAWVSVHPQVHEAEDEEREQEDEQEELDDASAATSTDKGHVGVGSGVIEVLTVHCDCD